MASIPRCGFEDGRRECLLRFGDVGATGSTSSTFGQERKQGYLSGGKTTFQSSTVVAVEDFARRKPREKYSPAVEIGDVSARQQEGERPTVGVGQGIENFGGPPAASSGR